MLEGRVVGDFVDFVGGSGRQGFRWDGFVGRCRFVGGFVGKVLVCLGEIVGKQSGLSVPRGAASPYVKVWAGCEGTW